MSEYKLSKTIEKFIIQCILGALTYGVVFLMDLPHGEQTMYIILGIAILNAAINFLKHYGDDEKDSSDIDPHVP